MDNGKTLRDYEARAQKVRADLKQWEADWAKGHDGKKPGRDDIKSNPSIAQKYKDYNKLRDIISGKVVPAPAASTAKRESGSIKRKPHDLPPAETPHKKTKHLETPSKGQAWVDSNGYMDSPAVSRKLFSPVTITSLGPTPQRDGKVLGLFDLLVEKELGASPRQQVSGGGRGNARSHPSNVQATPSRRRKDDESLKLGHTPSSGKKRAAGLFATPIKKKDDREAGTPSSVSKLTFETPAFLRRQKLPTLDEQSSFDAPAPLRLPRKPFARGLSEIITSLRKVEEELEEEHADDDLKALEEAQMGETELGQSVPQQKPKSAPGSTSEKPKAMLDSDVLKPDHQKPQLLGGFDDEGLYDSPDEEKGKPMRIFKKKGQKRTTRRVNIKPTRHKRPTDSTANGEVSDVEDDEAQRVVAANNGSGSGARDDAEAGESGDDFVDDGADDDDDDGYDGQKRTSTQKQKGAKTGEKENVVKKAARKVNELAHANFQRLKLRNHGAKGGPGHNSRFRRRR